MSSKYEIWGSCTHGEPPEYRNNSSALATEWLAVLTAPKSLSYCTTFPTLTIHIERHDQGWLSNSRHHLNHRGTHSHRCTGSGHRHSRCRRTSSSRAHHYHHECLCRRHHLLDHLECSIFSFLGIVYFSMDFCFAHGNDENSHTRTKEHPFGRPKGNAHPTLSASAARTRAGARRGL
jgi:hypothetical protein